MRRIVFLLEEFSMRVFLEGLLPRLLPGLAFQCVHHEGRQDLERSIPRKLRAWREPGVRFVVVRDNDGLDCFEVKRRLVDLCAAGGRPEALVRIACQELEAWYLGDFDALAEAFADDSLKALATKARFRNPDAVAQPSRALTEIAPAFQKVSGARAMASRMKFQRNTSRSFQVFVAGVHELASPEA